MCTGDFAGFWRAVVANKPAEYSYLVHAGEHIISGEVNIKDLVVIGGHAPAWGTMDEDEKDGQDQDSVR